MILDQSSVDALIAQQLASGIQKKPAAPGGDLLSQVGLAADGGVMDQGDVDKLINQQPNKGRSVVKRVKQIPNPLGARTLGLHEIEEKKLLRSHANSSVTGMRRPRWFTPQRAETYDTALTAIERLFALANQFRDSNTDNSYDEIASVANKFGQDTTIALTRDRAKPVRIRIKGIQTCNAYKRMVESSHTYDVDRFAPNEGPMCRRWVDWFTTNFDDETLQGLSGLT